VTGSIVPNSSDAMSALAISVFFIAGVPRFSCRRSAAARVAQFGELSKMTLLQRDCWYRCAGLISRSRPNIEPSWSIQTAGRPISRFEVDRGIANSQDRRIRTQCNCPLKPRAFPGPEANEGPITSISGESLSRAIKAITREREMCHWRCSEGPALLDHSRRRPDCVDDPPSFMKHIRHAGPRASRADLRIRIWPGLDETGSFYARQQLTWPKFDCG
jgi:hypothetical protein